MRSLQARALVLVGRVSRVTSACFLCGLLAYVAPTGAQAAAVRPTITLRVPAAAIGGRPVAIRGRITRITSVRRVVLERRLKRGRWRPVGRARTHQGGRSFTVRWTPPRRTVVVELRVRALKSRSRRRLASAVARLPISDTQVIGRKRILSAPSAGQPGTLVIDGRSTIRSGQFIAARVGPETPEGFLAKVTRVRHHSGDTQVSTRPASLLEAVPEGHILLTPELAAASGTPGRSAQQDNSASFTENMSCSTGVSAELGGSARAAIKPALELEWGFLKVKSARASATLSGEAELHASVNGSANCTLSSTAVATWTARPITFSLGPVPVVIIPQTTIYLSGGAEATGELRTSITGAIAATAGLEVDPTGKVAPIQSFSQQMNWTAPSQRVDGKLYGTITPSVAFLIYGVAGPRFDLGAGLNLDVTTQGAPWWRLTLPISLTGRLTIPHFDKFAVGPIEIFSTEIDLADSGAPDPARANPVYPERARMIWDTGQTDVDLHVWDEEGNHAWYRGQRGIPDSQLSLDITDGFGPEIFTDETPETPRTFTYGICYYDDEDLGPTNATVGITDPNGETRRFERHLAQERDHVMLGSSPPGNDYDPGDSWCRG